MVRYFAFLVVAFCSLSSLVSSVQAQGEGALHGVVIAKADRSPLPNTEIRLEGSTLLEPLRTRTGESGHFGFQRLIPGDYTLVALHQDFLEERLRFTLKPREDRNMALELSLRPVTGSVEVKAEAITVDATYSPSSTVLQDRAVEELPLGQKNSLPDVIGAAAPSMVRGHDDFVHVRGSEIALNTFINGVSFWENPHAVFSAGLNPEVIQSVNVMTGGFPAEYGNRFGGVLDVVSKSGFTMDHQGTLTLGIGMALRHNLGIEYGGHTEKAAWYVFSSGFESARFLSPPDPRAIHDTGRGMQNFLQLEFNVNANNFLKLVLMGDGTNFEIPKTSVDAAVRPNANAFERTREQTAILSWNHIISQDALLNTSFYQRWSRSLLLPAVDPLAAKARVDRTLGTTGIKSDLTRFFSRHTIKGGLDFVLLRPEEELFYDSTGYRAFSHLLHLPHVHLSEPISFAERKSGGQISFYLQDKIQVTNRLTADVGLRYDRYSLAVSDFHFSPRLNLAYRLPATNTVLHASYDHFFVPPAVENVLASSAGLTRFIREIGSPLPPIRPIVENQFELGFTHRFHRNFQLGLAGYSRISNNPVHTVLFPDSRIYTYANFDKGRARGLEVKMNVPVIERLGLSGYLNYAWGRVYLYNPVVAGFVDEAHHVEETGRFLAPMDQTHTLNAGVTYRHQKTGFWTGMTFEYGSGTPLEAEPAEETAPAAEMTDQRVPQHFTQNLTIGLDLLRNAERPRLGLQFNIENLTNNVYRVAQESMFSPGQYSIPRLFSGSVKIRF